MIHRLRELVHRIDEPLVVHLEAAGAEFHTFAFRWMNCLLLRELPLRLMIRLWDTYIAEARNSIAALVAKFGGRLFVLGDIDAVPAMSEAERADFLATLNRAFDGKVEAVGWGHDGPAIRHMLKANALPHQEAFLVGAGIVHRVLGDAAGLPLTKDIEDWFA